MNKINRIATLDSLMNVPNPEQTRTYKPLLHKDLDVITKDLLQKNNYELINTTYLTAKDGKQAIGRYNINYGDDKDMGLMIAWQNSYDKSTTVKYAIGSNVFVCSNGMVMGDMGAYAHRHSGDVQIITPQTIEEYIKTSADTFAQMVKDKERMKEIELTKRTCAELLGRMFVEDKIITANQLGIIKREMEAPTFEYGTKNTAWNLMNNITFSLKEAHPKLWMKQHIDSYKFLKNELFCENEG